MGTPTRPDQHGHARSRPGGPVPETPKNSSDYGGNLVGSDVDDPHQPTPARRDAGKRGDDDAATSDQPIGSALASATGRNDDAPGGGATAGAGNDLGSGSGTLGATSGGERASAGRNDANRSSRDHGNSLDE